MKKISINPDWCKRCGICADGCPRRVFDKARDGLPLPVRLEDCTACNLCVLRCPDFAVTLEVDGNE